MTTKTKANILQTEIADGVVVVTLDTPGEKVNKLNEELIEEFSEADGTCYDGGIARALITGAVLRIFCEYDGLTVS